MNRRFSRRAMAVGAVLVAALGLTMLSSGMNLAGASFPTAGAGTAARPQPPGRGRAAGEPPPFAPEATNPLPSPRAFRWSGRSTRPRARSTAATTG
jgi:hypothetical protein